LAGDDTLLVLFADNPTAAEFCLKINTVYLKEE
jgi:arginine repressor